MKKILSLCIMGLLLISSCGLFIASSSAKEEPMGDPLATHRVLGEFGTATWCGYCKYAHGALKEIYKNEWHEFNYVSLVCDKNKHAYGRAVTDLGLSGYPTVFWDGDYTKNVGASSIPAAIAAYNSSIKSCGSRSVANVDLDISVSWLGSATMDITVTVDNNGGSTYNGYLRCYVTEISSSMGWKDTYGLPYTFPFLDYAFDQSISAPSGGSWSDTVSWDGAEHDDGYGNTFDEIEKDNMFIIASVFASKGGYVDETAEIRVGNNRAPNTPSDPDPEDEETDVELEPTLTWDGGDPDWFDDVYYDVYFEKNNSDPELVAEDITEAEYTPEDPLEMETTYYWKIVAEDEYGKTATGPVWEFTTRGNEPPNVPYNPNPGDGETDVSILKTLSWSGGDPDGDKTYYNVFLEAENPDPELVAENQTSRSYNPGQLLYETTYYWKIVARDKFGEIAEGPVWSFTTQVAVPDLECTGIIQWVDVPAGSTCEGEFIIKNIGTPSSKLDWEIDSYPEWGDWTFSPESYEDLTPEEGDFAVGVTVVAPLEEDTTYTGDIKIINSNEPSDYDSIPVVLRTPRSKSVFLNFLERILDSFPLLRSLFGL